MGTQFQRLTASSAWGPEAVQADSARHLEAHHVVSQARLQLPRRFRRPPQPQAEQHVWPWHQKGDPNQHRPLCPELSPSGRPLACCGIGAWNLLGPNPNPNPTLNRDPQPKPKPAPIPNPAIELPSGRAPTSALEADHKTGVVLVLATSLDRTQSLSKAVSPWGPNFNV